MLLYHYSPSGPWPEILASGRLEPLWPAEDCGWPRTVHLTDEADRLPTGFAEGRALRFTVDVDAHPWCEWGRRYVPRQAWLSVGIRIPYPPPGHSGLSRENQDADHWYVTTEPIPTSQWVEVRLLSEDRVLWPAPPT